LLLSSGFSGLLAQDIIDFNRFVGDQSVDLIPGVFKFGSIFPVVSVEANHHWCQ
jgi:hypothetical protein